MRVVKREGQKVYIEGVKKMSWDTGEMCEFASALIAAMECLGEELPYHSVMGTSGAAFRFTINPGEWDFGNYSIRNIAEDPYAAVRRSLDATGYEYTLYEKDSREEDLARIMASIERGVPVLAFGVVGPSDCCILTGYDEAGDVLLGWSTYQDIPDDHPYPHDSTGYFRKLGWHDNLGGTILIGPKGERPPRRDIALQALQWGAHLLRTPRMGTRATGLEGLRVWAEEMTQEVYFPAGDEELLGWRYVSVAINMTMLRDHLAAGPFLRQIAQEEPDLAPELEQVLAAYEAEYRLRDRMDEIMKDDFSAPAMKAISDPEARRAYAGLIQQIREAETQALAHLERLLARMVE